MNLCAITCLMISMLVNSLAPVEEAVQTEQAELEAVKVAAVFNAEEIKIEPLFVPEPEPQPQKQEQEQEQEQKQIVICDDVPLDADLQLHIISECEKHDIDPAIVFAMIKQESNFEADLIDDNGDSFGLMQVQPKWHRDRMDRLGCDDLLDPYQNTTVGIDLLAELLAKDKGLEWALMAYNGGASYANKKAAAGVVSSYAREVMTESEELKK